MREGEGQIVYEDGRIVKGTWVKDMMHGTFLVKTKNNSTYTEYWSWGNCQKDQTQENKQENEVRAEKTKI